MKNEMPNRKHPRLDKFDYSSVGAYFVTICAQDRRCFLSEIVDKSTEDKKTDITVRCTKYGLVAERLLLDLHTRFPFVEVDKYVIMPNHIHILFIFRRETEAGENRATLMDVVGAYKSLASIECKKIGLDGKMFQTSFYEHIIRNRNDYEQTLKYIEDNPLNWYYDELYNS